MKRLILVAGCLLSLCACSSSPPSTPPPKLPYEAWSVALAAPKHMEVWVETVDVLDRRGLAFFHVHGGVAGYPRKTNGLYVAGSLKPVSNVDLPERILLRWQSLVEPQAYKLRLTIPQWVRDEMVRSERAYCKGSKEWIDDYRDSITLGMAPGGIVKVWVGGACLGFKEVGRYQAEVEPRGPYLGKTHGKYVPLEPENRAYVEQHGIPYGSW